MFKNGRANAHLTMLISAGPQRFRPLSETESHGRTAYKRSKARPPCLAIGLWPALSG